MRSCAEYACGGGRWLHLVADEDALVRVEFGVHNGIACHPSPALPLLREAAAQLDAYFRGALRKFDLPLHPAGTPFQLRVWEALQRIPYGARRSYLQIAAEIGDPCAVRAVGAANGRNPLPILIPCHRVIGSSGKLTGFGGGLAWKQFLLDLEAGKVSLWTPQ
jgi:methylated-DNA-[protein]-cysteine S-methyltransferase